MIAGPAMAYQTSYSYFEWLTMCAIAFYGSLRWLYLEADLKYIQLLYCDLQCDKMMSGQECDDQVED